jgi:hypothetical protein
MYTVHAAGVTVTQRLVVPLLLLPLAACGTTVPLSQQGSAGTSVDSLGAPAVPGSTSGAAELGGTTGGTTGSSGATASVGSPSSTGGVTGTTGTSGTTGTRPATSTTGGRADRSPVRVGLLYLDGADAAASSIGISGLSTGDALAQARAVVAKLNATGGLAGRRIDLRVGKMDAARAVSNPDATYATACATLTQDEKVAYDVSYVNLTSARLACYAKRGVTVLDDQSGVVDSAGAKYASTFAAPGELAYGRAANELVDALWRRGWLTSASKVGTLVPDTTDGAEIETRFLLPALARHGLKSASSFRAGGASSAGSNVLKFRTAGVDRVIPMGQSPLFLMSAAESQGYRPAYAMNSGFGPGALLESAAPRAQLKNAAGIGWSKFLDIGAGTRPGPVSSNETLCFALMRQAGQQSTSGTTQAFQLSLCNVLMYLKAATDSYGVTAGLLGAVRTRGLAFAPADAYAIRAVPGRADGVGAYRDVAFDDSCSCFQYTSGDHSTR